MHKNVPKGTPIPMTGESLLAIMERDAIFIEQQALEIADLKWRLEKLTKKWLAARGYPVA